MFPAFVIDPHSAQRALGVPRGLALQSACIFVFSSQPPPCLQPVAPLGPWPCSSRLVLRRGPVQCVLNPCSSPQGLSAWTSENSGGCRALAVPLACPCGRDRCPSVHMRTWGSVGSHDCSRGHELKVVAFQMRMSERRAPGVTRTRKRGLALSRVACPASRASSPDTHLPRAWLGTSAVYPLGPDCQVALKSSMALLL